LTSQPPDPSVTAARSNTPSDRPAAIAAARVSRAGVGLGTLGLASFAFVLLRLFETWRVSPHTVSHHISILGQELSYPAANAAAVVVLLLAILGTIVAAKIVFGAARELAAARRFDRRIASDAPVHLHDALVIDDEHPHAFCAGLLRPRVYVTSGALAILDEPALGAVLMHERHHAWRRDPLRLAAARVLAQAMFFLPGLRELRRRQQALAELSADESAINAAPGNRSALARAMLSFSDSSEPGDAVGIDPARVDYLLGEPPSWPFPAMLCLAAVGVLALIVAVALLVGQEVVGSATLAPPFLSSQPCVVVLAIIPASLGLIAVRIARPDRRSWRAPTGLRD
jgi:BlaR1 peptidase M56